MKRHLLAVLALAVLLIVLGSGKLAAQWPPNNQQYTSPKKFALTAECRQLRRKYYWYFEGKSIDKARAELHRFMTKHHKGWQQVKWNFEIGEITP